MHQLGKAGGKSSAGKRPAAARRARSFCPQPQQRRCGSSSSLVPGRPPTRKSCAMFAINSRPNWRCTPARSGPRRRASKCPLPGPGSTTCRRSAAGRFAAPTARSWRLCGGNPADHPQFGFRSSAGRLRMHRISRPFRCRMNCILWMVGKVLLIAVGRTSIFCPARFWICRRQPQRTRRKRCAGNRMPCACSLVAAGNAWKCQKSASSFSAKIKGVPADYSWNRAQHLGTIIPFRRSAAWASHHRFK